MLIGNAPPEWAENLIDHWVQYTDPQLGTRAKAFVLYADSESTNVRIFAITFDSALKESQTGQVDGGLIVALIEEGECVVIDTPPGLENWTTKSIEQSEQAENALGIKP